MKNFIALLFSVIMLASCSNSTKENTTSGSDSTATAAGQSFGAKIDENGALAIAELPEKVKATGSVENVKVTAPIDAVCQQKGCWMNLALGNGETMRVTFKDYGFFVPKDCAGKTAIVQGRAYMDTTTVEMLKEYAKDDGNLKKKLPK